MNLLQILKRDLKRWPPGGFVARQNFWGKVFFVNGPAEWDHGGWHWSADLFVIEGPVLESARDRESVSVTKSEWEAA